MNITLILTAEQESALLRSHVSSYPDEPTRPRFEAFVQGVLDAKVLEHVQAWSGRDIQKTAEDLTAKIVSITSEDRAILSAVVDKYAVPSPKEVELVNITNDERETTGMPATAYIFQIRATGTHPLRYTVKGLPDGLVCDRETGLIAGEPKAEGKFPLTLIVENDVPSNDYYTITLNVTKDGLSPVEEVITP